MRRTTVAKRLTPCFVQNSVRTQARLLPFMANQTTQRNIALVPSTAPMKASDSNSFVLFWAFSADPVDA